MAWTPFDNSGRTLVRGGVGAYYDENHQNISTLLFNLSILVQRSVSLNAASPQLNPFWPDQARARRFLAEAFAQNALPDIALLPGVVGGFLLQHALSGWCPPVTLLRRLGFRTAGEIHREKYALKALRGDFAGVARGANGEASAAEAAYCAVQATRH